MTKTIDIAAAHAPLSELVALALAGTEVILTEGDTPVARLAPILSARKPRIAGLNPGAIWTSEDFDSPLPEEFWTEGA